MVASKWTYDDPRGSVQSLVQSWFWNLPEPLWSERDRQMLSAYDLDFFVLHAGFERLIMEAGLPDARLNIPQALIFVGKIGAQEHLALYEQVVSTFESVFDINRTDIGEHDLNELFVLNPAKASQFNDEVGPLHLRAYELDRKRALNDYIWVEVNSWSNFCLVEESEFDRLLATKALAVSGGS